MVDGFTEGAKMKTPEELAGEYATWLTNKAKAVRDVADSEEYALFVGFLEGYKVAKDQVADTSKVMNSSNNSNGWVSVKERLPEDGQEVLVFEEGTISTNCFSNRREPFLRWDLYPNGFSCDPSHWMPLPEAPKGEG